MSRLNPGMDVKQRRITLTQDDLDGATAGGRNCIVARALRRNGLLAENASVGFYTYPHPAAGDPGYTLMNLSRNVADIIDRFDESLPHEPSGQVGDPDALQALVGRVIVVEVPA